jgi:hypothetical protein
VVTFDHLKREREEGRWVKMADWNFTPLPNPPAAPQKEGSVGT